MTLNYSDDVFLGGRLKLRQPVSGLRAGLDAIVLAAALPISHEEPSCLLDAGAGSGIVGLAGALRAPHLNVTLLEIQPQLVELARQSVNLNDFDERITVIEADLTSPLKQLQPLGLEPETFDHVAANPPYQIVGEGRLPGNNLKSGASAMSHDALERWIRFLAAMVRPGGTATLVHRADAIGRLLASLQRRFGDIVVFPLFPHNGEPAHRVLIQGTKGSRAPLSLMPGLVLHQADGTFRPEIDAILRDGAGLDLHSGAIKSAAL